MDSHVIAPANLLQTLETYSQLAQAHSELLGLLTRRARSSGVSDQSEISMLHESLKAMAEEATRMQQALACLVQRNQPSESVSGMQTRSNLP